jgi:hypothetical protein
MLRDMTKPFKDIQIGEVFTISRGVDVSWVKINEELSQSNYNGLHLRFKNDASFYVTGQIDFGAVIKYYGTRNQAISKP